MRWQPPHRTPRDLPALVADPSADPTAALIDAERMHAERLLNYVRALVLLLLGIAALAYASRNAAALNVLNVAVIAPMAAWTLAQHFLMSRHPRTCRWLRVVNPFVDLSAISVLLVGYGLLGTPMLAVRSPLFLAYFVILAARPITSSATAAAFVSVLAVLEYALIVTFFAGTGRVAVAADPVTSLSTDAVSVLDQGARLLLLATVGAITTYATWWYEHLLRRAVGSQVRRAREERALEEQLRHADKMAALGTLAASVAHEVASPLTSIALMADMLQEHAANDEVRQDAATIASEARRTSTVIRELLQIARPQTELAGDVPLADVAGRALALLRVLIRDANITIETSFDPAAPPLHGDGGRLEQLVLNLVINAIHALESAPVPRVIRLTTAADPRGLRLDIEDSGPGIPAHLQPRIFERFFTTKDSGKGTGLGLWIVRQIVEEHGGTIEAGRSPLGGARFRLLFRPGQRDRGLTPA